MFKYCLYDHLQLNPLNALFLHDYSSNFNIDSAIESYKNDGFINDKIIQDINTSSKLPQNNNNNSKSIVKSIIKIQEQWIKYHNEYSLIIKFLFLILKCFPTEYNDASSSSSSSKTFVNTTYCDLYIQISNLINSQSSNTDANATSNKKFIECEQFINLKKLLQLSSINTFNEISNKLLNLLENLNHTYYNTNFVNELIKLSEMLQQQLVEHNVITYNNDLSDNDENNEEQVSPKKAIKRSQSLRKSKGANQKPLLDNSNIYQHRESQCEEFNSPTKEIRRRKTQSHIANPNSQNRNKFMEWLNNQCSTYFNLDYTRKFDFLSNCFCYNNIDNTKEHLFNMQRIAIHDALINPFKYFSQLNANGLTVMNKNKNDKDLLPISVIYKLFLECGHMINLYDWLQACQVFFVLFCFLSKFSEIFNFYIIALFNRLLLKKLKVAI